MQCTPLFRQILIPGGICGCHQASYSIDVPVPQTGVFGAGCEQEYVVLRVVDERFPCGNQLIADRETLHLLLGEEPFNDEIGLLVCTEVLLPVVVGVTVSGAGRESREDDTAVLELNLSSLSIEMDCHRLVHGVDPICIGCTVGYQGGDTDRQGDQCDSRTRDSRVELGSQSENYETVDDSCETERYRDHRGYREDEAEERGRSQSYDSGRAVGPVPLRHVQREAEHGDASNETKYGHRHSFQGRAACCGRGVPCGTLTWVA